jgi:predicted acetyltransferase
MADFDYRALPEERDDDFEEMTSYAFRIEDGPPGGEDASDGSDEEDGDDPDLGHERGVFDGEELVAVCRQYYWPTTVRGREVSLAGLSAVASSPENRRRGAVAELVAGSLAEYYEEGCAFAALWPFDRAFYARYGYGTANCFATVECPVEDLAFAEEFEAGEFRPVGPDGWAALDAVYRDHSAGRNLALDRDEDWWRERVFDGHRGDPYVYGFERGGDLAGYLVYTVEEEDDDEVFWVTESAWTDEAAFLNLLRFCYYHDSQVDRVRIRGAPGGSLRDVLDYIPSPGYEDVEYDLWAGLMVRIVDVADALESIGYPTGVDDRIRIAVDDDTVERNDGTFVLDVSEGRANCEPAGPGAEAEVEVSVGTLSQAAVGYRPVDRLQYAGELSADEDALRRLGAVFPADEVFLRDFF